MPNIEPSTFNIKNKEIAKIWMGNQWIDIEHSSFKPAEILPKFSVLYNTDADAFIARTADAVPMYQMACRDATPTSQLSAKAFMQRLSCGTYFVSWCKRSQKFPRKMEKLGSPRLMEMVHDNMESNFNLIIISYHDVENRETDIKTKQRQQCYISSFVSKLDE